MFRFVRTLFGIKTKHVNRKRRPASRPVRLSHERLEQRDLMAVAVSIVNHDLFIYGTDGPDQV
jgi:hypothetical protein